VIPDTVDAAACSNVTLAGFVVVDDRWAWVTDIANPDPNFTYSYGPTGTVHLEDCARMNRNTILRPIAPADPVWHRCDHCLGRDARYQITEARRRHEEATLATARAADPDLSRRVRERRERLRAERGY
jgi:hypothetical protein